MTNDRFIYLVGSDQDDSADETVSTTKMTGENYVNVLCRTKKGLNTIQDNIHIQQIHIYHDLFRLQTSKNSSLSLAPNPTLFNLPVLPNASCKFTPRISGRWEIRTRMPCLKKLVARHIKGPPEGVGRVMSSGEYFILAT